MVAGGLSKSCLRIIEILLYSDGLSQREVMQKLRLSERTVKYSLKMLKEQNLIVELVSLRDVRRKIYFYGGKK